MIVGFDTSDDASVYLVRDDLAVIQTIDFFPPIVDDPYTFGQIAAANAISDVYAMGGEPKTALNLLCVPAELEKKHVRAILEGGADKAMEAGIVVAGGHSIEDVEPKYGMAVTGFCHPSLIRTNSGAKPGDVLILTKRLGSGILTTAMKSDLCDPKTEKQVIATMAHLNKVAAEQMQAYTPSACTDITGFGLLGHVAEMAQSSGVSVVIHANHALLLDRVLEFARDGIIPAGAYRNRDYVKDHVTLEATVSRDVADVLYDPQTSGGLLIAVAARFANTLLERLKDAGEYAAIIGEVLPKTDVTVRVI